MTSTSEQQGSGAPVDVPHGTKPEIVRVYRHWVLIYGKTRHPLTPKRLAAIESCLDEGIDANTCIAWIEYVGSGREETGRASLPDLTTLFRAGNVRRLREHFGLAKAARVNWLAPFEAVWLKHYPGSNFPFGMVARPLRRAIERHGESILVLEFDAYLARTPLDYLNFHKFAAIVPHWRSKPARGPNETRFGGGSALLPSDKPVTIIRE